MQASLSVVKLLLGLAIILAKGIKRQEIKLANPLSPHLLKNYFILTAIFGTIMIIIISITIEYFYACYVNDFVNISSMTRNYRHKC